jgi:hypothetical protein
MKLYKLLAADGSTEESVQPGTLGGNSQDRIYGDLNCPSANRHLPSYARIRVFFANEAAAIAARYRPCHTCMYERWKQWNQGGSPGSADYPWLILPGTTTRNGSANRSSTAGS